MPHLRLRETIGLGTFGVVYAGTYNGNPVAVKEVARSRWEEQNGYVHADGHGGALPGALFAGDVAGVFFVFLPRRTH